MVKQIKPCKTCRDFVNACLVQEEVTGNWVPMSKFFSKADYDRLEALIKNSNKFKAGQRI